MFTAQINTLYFTYFIVARCEGDAGFQPHLGDVMPREYSYSSQLYHYKDLKLLVIMIVRLMVYCLFRLFSTFIYILYCTIRASVSLLRMFRSLIDVLLNLYCRIKHTRALRKALPLCIVK